MQHIRTVHIVWSNRNQCCWHNKSKLSPRFPFTLKQRPINTKARIYDYRIGLNSGVTIAKRMDNSIVQLASNYVGVEPYGTLSAEIDQSNHR